MKQLTDLEKLKEVLLNQSPRGITSGDYAKLKYELERNEIGNQILRIRAIEVCFVFTRRGRLIGGYNWKE